MSQRHNFSKEEAKQKAKYRLWLLIAPEQQPAFQGRNSMIFYSYFPNDPERGLKRLKELAWRYKTRFILQYARIYNTDNKVVDEIKGLVKLETYHTNGNKPKRPRIKIRAVAKVPVNQPRNVATENQRSGFTEGLGSILAKLPANQHKD